MKTLTLLFLGANKAKGLIKNENNEKMKRLQIAFVFLFLTIILFISWLFFRDYALAFDFMPPIDSNIFSDWGGFISGIMAFSAFVYAFHTFILQQKSINKSDLENNFFRLINQLQFIVEQINIQLPDKNEIEILNNEDELVYKIKEFQTDKYSGFGRHAIHVFLLNLLQRFKDKDLDDFESQYNDFYNNFGHYLGHYFRFVYHIIKFIDESDLGNERQRYMDLFQAQLSSDEMGLLFYNSIYGEKSKKKKTEERKFKQLLDEYKILENIDDSSLNEKTIKSDYFPKTFGE